MKRVLLDTNVVLSFLTDRDPRQQARAAALFEDAASSRLRLLLHQSVASESVYVLLNLYRRPPATLRTILSDLVSLPGMDVVDAVSWRRVLSHWPDPFADFGDAVLAAVALEERVDAVATFDRRFATRMAKRKVAGAW